MPTGGAKPPEVAGSKSMGQGMDQTFQHMLRQESGDHQFSKGGGTVTSKKGALGAAQVMPGTAPYAAKLAGLPYDPQKLRTDAGYNKALGQAYYNKQLETFGSPEKAAAAYNAGPGNVQKALDRGAKTGTPWQSHLPSETQKYIKAVTGGGTPSQRGGSTPQQPKQASSGGTPMPAAAASTPSMPSGTEAPSSMDSMQSMMKSMSQGSTGPGIGGMGTGSGLGKMGGGGGQQQSQGGGKSKDDLIKIPDAPTPAPNYFAKNQSAGGSPWQKAYKDPKASLSDIIQAA